MKITEYLIDLSQLIPELKKIYFARTCVNQQNAKNVYQWKTGKSVGKWIDLTLNVRLLTNQNSCSFVKSRNSSLFSYFSFVYFFVNEKFRLSELLCHS